MDKFGAWSVELYFSARLLNQISLLASDPETNHGAVYELCTDSSPRSKWYLANLSQHPKQFATYPYEDERDAETISELPDKSG